RVDFERAGVRRSVELMMPLVPGRQLWPVYQFCGLFFFACGAALALLRPNDAQVRLIGTVLMAVGFSTLHEALQPAYPFLVGWERKVHFAEVPIALWTFPLVYHFFSRFPLWQSPGAMWRTIQWLLYGVLILVLWPVWMTSYIGLGVSERATRFLIAHPAFLAADVTTNGAPNLPYIGACVVPRGVGADRARRHDGVARAP